MELGTLVMERRLMEGQITAEEETRRRKLSLAS
jgi:hypothetical protein